MRRDKSLPCLRNSAFVLTEGLSYVLYGGVYEKVGFISSRATERDAHLSGFDRDDDHVANSHGSIGQTA
jgi:hypothetical protein